MPPALLAAFRDPKQGKGTLPFCVRDVGKGVSHANLSTPREGAGCKRDAGKELASWISGENRAQSVV